MDSTPTRRVITDQDVAQLVERGQAARAGKLDVAKMVSLRLRHNKTHEEIAEIVGCTRETVGKALGKFIKFVEDPTELAAYRENKPDFYEGVELKVLGMLEQRLSDPTYKPPIKDLAAAMKVLVEMRRLETGQSTDNIAVFTKSIEDAHKNLFVEAVEVKDVSEGSQSHPA
jgi:predicted transcriptional regulator